MEAHLQNRIISKWNYEMYRTILFDSKLKVNTKYTAQAFKIDEGNLCAVIEEYEKSGCIILNSKMNGRYKIN